MLENIEKQDNKILLISEKEQQVFLPYTLKELEDYLDQFPDAYSSTDDVIKKEFVLPLAYYISHPAFSRFREAYSLSRDREAKPFLESLRYGIDMMFYDKLNPAIIDFYSLRLFKFTCPKSCWLNLLFSFFMV